MIYKELNLFSVSKTKSRVSKSLSKKVGKNEVTSETAFLQ